MQMIKHQRWRLGVLLKGSLRWAEDIQDWPQNLLWQELNSHSLPLTLQINLYAVFLNLGVKPPTLGGYEH